MSFAALQRDFQALKKIRRVDPARAIRGVGNLATDALNLLEAQFEPKSFAFKGAGNKQYGVFVKPGTGRPFSRPYNSDLFVASPREFTSLWERFVAALERSSDEKDNLFAAILEQGSDPADRFVLSGISREDVDRALYTVVIGYAAVVDLLSRGNRSQPGILFEMAVGPAISLLTGRSEGGAIKLEVPDADGEVTVTTDLSFVGDAHVLVVPTKITTRERISQPFVHQRILDAAQSGMYRSVLCICSENNVACPPQMPEEDRTYDACWVQDTLVPGTIALYQTYVAPLSGLYYIDPPQPYLDGTRGGLPPVRRFGSLLTEDLPALLAPTTY